MKEIEPNPEEGMSDMEKLKFRLIKYLGNKNYDTSAEQQLVEDVYNEIKEENEQQAV